MPPALARFRRVLTCVALLGLALTGAALAGNGGFAPAPSASPNEGGIRAIYWVILGITGAIFLIVEIALVLFVVRYRSRGRARELEGARVEVLEQEDYDMWVQGRLSRPDQLGRETFQGTCAKCHGLSGQGDIGPPIAQSPLLRDRTALTTLIRNGGVKMPAVGKTWSDEQLKATLDYLRNRFKAGGGSGG